LSPDSIDDGTDNIAVTLPFIPFSTLIDEMGVESPSLTISKVIDAKPGSRSPELIPVNLTSAEIDIFAPELMNAGYTC